MNELLCKIGLVKNIDLLRWFQDILEGSALLWFRTIVTEKLSWADLQILLLSCYEYREAQLQVVKYKQTMTPLKTFLCLFKKKNGFV